MAFVNVNPDGNAPAGLNVGDVVQTAGGNYQIVAPDTAGASYNKESGYWSVPSTKVASDFYDGLMGYAKEMADYNTAKSIEMAQHQMDFQTAANAKAMKFNMEEAEKNRAFQERLANTAHQREVADLIAAGLNPILSANGGAAVTSGSQASGVTSAGAQGQVDISTLANTLGHLIQQQTSQYVADVQRDTQLQTSMISANAMKAVANIQGEWQKYMAEHYPNNVVEALAGIFGGIFGGSPGETAGDFFSGGGPIGSATELGMKAGEWTRGVFDQAYKNVYNLVGYLESILKGNKWSFADYLKFNKKKLAK